MKRRLLLCDKDQLAAQEASPAILPDAEDVYVPLRVYLSVHPPKASRSLSDDESELTYRCFLSRKGVRKIVRGEQVEMAFPLAILRAYYAGESPVGT